MKTALVTIGLVSALIHCGNARAEEALSTIFLSDVKVDVVGKANGAFTVDFLGTFLVPQMAPGVSISMDMKYDVGIASWSQNVPGALYGGALEGSVGWSINPQGGTIDRYSAENQTDGPLFQIAGGATGRYGMESDAFSVYSPNLKDGYVPFYLYMHLSFAAAESYPHSVDAS